MVHTRGKGKNGSSDNLSPTFAIYLAGVEETETKRETRKRRVRIRVTVLTIVVFVKAGIVAFIAVARPFRPLFPLF